MGTGITELMARNGYYTTLYDLEQHALHKAATLIKNNLAQLVSKGKITGKESADAWSRILFTTDLNHCIADLVVEAIAEEVSAKIALFNQLAEINHSETVFTSNTSSISVTAIAEKIPHPERIAGMHFFNPAQIMKLVEIVHTSFTSQEVVNQLLMVTEKTGKTAVVCKDSPGFIVNRVARPFYLEALRLVEQEAAGITDIDDLIESAGFRMGPFRLMDLIGNDINYAVSESLYESLNKPKRLQPSILQLQKIQSGQLGKKTGKGYYDYTSNT